MADLSLAFMPLLRPDVVKLDLRLRGADLAQTDPLRHEWDIVVLAPHFAAALLARDLGDDGRDEQRRFEFALTYDRDVVSAAAEALLARVAPHSSVASLCGENEARLRPAS